MKPVSLAHSATRSALSEPLRSASSAKQSQDSKSTVVSGVHHRGCLGMMREVLAKTIAAGAILLLDLDVLFCSRLSNPPLLSNTG